MHHLDRAVSGLNLTIGKFEGGLPKKYTSISNTIVIFHPRIRTSTKSI